MSGTAVVAAWEWQVRGNCHGHSDPDQFFPTAASGWAARLSRPPKHIQQLCDTCPVRIECLTHALNWREIGIWGGTTDAQRAAMRRTIRRSHCPTCGGTHLLAAGRNQICGDCGTSWAAHTTPARSRSRRPNLGVRHRRAGAAVV